MAFNEESQSFNVDSQQQLPTSEQFIETQGAGQSILDKPLPTVPRNYQARDRMEPAEYKDYMGNLDPIESELQQKEDISLNPQKYLSRKLVTDPIGGAVGGLGATIGKSQMLGLSRMFSSFQGDKAVVEYMDTQLNEMNSEVAKKSKDYGLPYQIGSAIGRNATGIAAGLYSGGSLPLLLMLEAGAQAIDLPGQPGVDGKPMGLVEGATTAATNVVGVAATQVVLTKLMPYVFRGFQSENISQALNPTTELGKKNYEQMAEAIEYAEEKGLRLSEIMVKGSGENMDGVQLVAGTNYFALREMFKGSDEFAGQSLDMLQDMITLGKKQAGNSSLTVNERRAAMMEFQEEVKALRKKYKDGENKIWGKVDEYMPTYKIELKGFNDELLSYLTKHGSDSQVISSVNNIVTRRFQIGHKELNKDLKVVENLRNKAKTEFVAWQKTEGKNVSQEKYVEKIGEYQRQNKEYTGRIGELRKAVKVSPKDLLNSIKLINKKINVPGGNISIHDAQQIRGLRTAKDFLETKLRDMISEDSPKALQYWDEAKKLTLSRVKSFGNNNSDESLVLTNAIMDKDTNKVLTMLKDPDMGLQHMDFIKQNFGGDSEAFRSASSLFLRSKLDMIDSSVQFEKKGTLVAPLAGDFQKIEDAVSQLTQKDVQFISKYFGKTGRDLNGYMRIVEQYSNLQRQVERATSGRGQMSAWRYAGKNPSEVPGIMTDLISYSSAKTANAFIKNMPVARSITGGGIGGITSLNDGEEFGSDAFYSQVLTGAGVGFALGKAGRHLFEPQIEQVVRVLKSRANAKDKLTAVGKFRDRVQKIQASIKAGRLRTRTPYDEAE